MKKFSFALLAVFVGMGAAVAAPDTTAMCELIAEMQSVFKILRTLAFVGAGFIMATWAWDMITKPKDNAPMTVAKDKGIPMLVGFVLLFGIGVVLQFLGPISGCENIVSGWR